MKDVFGRVGMGVGVPVRPSSHALGTDGLLATVLVQIPAAVPCPPECLAAVSRGPGVQLFDRP